MDIRGKRTGGLLIARTLRHNQLARVQSLGPLIVAIHLEQLGERISAHDAIEKGA